MSVTGVDHIVVNCSDVESSLQWYSERLGLAPDRVDEWRRGDAPFPSVRASVDFVIDLFDAAPTGTNLDHFCLVADAATVDALANDVPAELIAGPVERWGARGVALSVYVRDPDGNTVEVRTYER